MRVIILSVGSRLIVLFDALVHALVEFEMGEVWVSALIVFGPVKRL